MFIGEATQARKYTQGKENMQRMMTTIYLMQLDENLVSYVTILSYNMCLVFDNLSLLHKLCNRPVNIDDSSM